MQAFVGFVPAISTLGVVATAANQSADVIPWISAISPPVLFFFLGMFAAMVRSNLSIPKAVTKLLSLYLLWSIGFQGGVKLVQGGATADAAAALGASVALACLTPLIIFRVVRVWVSNPNAAALAAAYGSVSAVTFMTASALLTARGVDFGGHMVAAMALMESPAIVVAIFLLRFSAQTPRHQSPGAPEQGSGAPDVARHPELKVRKILHEALFNGPVLLMLGSMLIGVATGQRGYEAFKPLCTDVFNGVLVFFLLDLGILAARRMKDLRKAGWRLILFALLFAPLNAALAMGIARLLGLGVGDTVLLMTLAASASYIAVPAAVRLIIPQATPGLYIPLPLAVTFPFNIAFGIPIYLWTVTSLWET